MSASLDTETVARVNPRPGEGQMDTWYTLFHTLMCLSAGLLCNESLLLQSLVLLQIQSMSLFQSMSNLRQCFNMALCFCRSSAVVLII